MMVLRLCRGCGVGFVGDGRRPYCPPCAELPHPGPLPETKRCPQCGETKPAEAFSADRRDGLCGHCKACRSASAKRYRDTHRKTLSAYMREWARRKRAARKEQS